MHLMQSVSVFALVASAASVASADVILGNYPITNDATQTAGVNNLRRKAMAFAMPAGTDYTVSSITLRLGNFDANDTAFLEIRDHNGTITSPGANIIGSFTAPPGGGVANADYIFTAIGNITLTAGTSYWIYVHGAATPSTFDWKAATPAVTPTGIATFGPGNLFTANGGTSWSTSATITSFIIEGTAVPAPAVGALLALAGLCAARRRR